MTGLNTSLVKLVQNGHTNPLIEFADGQIVAHLVTEAGTRIPKLISAATFREAATGIPVDSGWLKPNFAFGGVCRWGVHRGVEWAVTFLPPSVHRVELTDADGTPEERVAWHEVPLPGVAWVGVGSKYFAFAVRTPRLDPYQELYRCPLPNVMQDGSVCWGMSKPPLSTGTGIAEAWALFAYRTTFNNHVVGAKSKREPEDVRRLLRSLAQSGEAYPVEDLVRQVADGGMTLDKAIKQFFETGVMPG